jgi:dephospho-CoA kinase
VTCLRIGLTGGIGSGKTQVSDNFANFAVPIIDADIIAHEITQNRHPALDKIASQFGREYVTDDGALDRQRMRKLVFDQPDKRKILEGILHPIIQSRMHMRAQACTKPYCILSIPLLLEGNNQGRVDRILVVDAPDANRRRWIKARSGLSDTEINGIFAAQVSRQKRLDSADDIITNDGSLKDLAEKVAELHERYLEISKSFNQDC